MSAATAEKSKTKKSSPASATPREATEALVASQEMRARFVRAGIFGAVMMIFLSSVALSPMFVSSDWRSFIAMAPLALTAGLCFGALLATNIFIDTE